MLLQIILGTPLRIWILLAGLIGLGLTQVRDRTIGSLRAALLPAVLVVVSLAGVISSFGASVLAVAAWAVGLGAAISAGPRALPPLRARWQAASDSLRVAGSWWPMLLIVALFLVKYAAGVSLALRPGLVSDGGFVVAFGLVFGVFSGLFAQRGWQLWRIRQTARTLRAA